MAEGTKEIVNKQRMHLVIKRLRSEAVAADRRKDEFTKRAETLRRQGERAQQVVATTVDAEQEIEQIRAKHAFPALEARIGISMVKATSVPCMCCPFRTATEALLCASLGHVGGRGST